MQVYVWHCCCAVAFIQNCETAELALLMVFSFTFLIVQNADTTFLMLLAEHNSEVFISIMNKVVIFHLRRSPADFCKTAQIGYNSMKNLSSGASIKKYAPHFLIFGNSEIIY
jgi:hypothetical protein